MDPGFRRGDDGWFDLNEIRSRWGPNSHVKLRPLSPTSFLRFMREGRKVATRVAIGYLDRSRFAIAQKTGAD